MRSDVLIYLSGPITAKHSFSIEENIAAAMKIYLQLLERGIPAFCPHASAIYPSAWNLSYETWMQYDFRMIDRCTHLLLLPRWELSKGAKLEWQYARAHEKSVMLWTSIEGLIAQLEEVPCAPC